MPRFNGAKADRGISVFSKGWKSAQARVDVRRCVFEALGGVAGGRGPGANNGMKPVAGSAAMVRAAYSKWVERVMGKRMFRIIAVSVCLGAGSLFSMSVEERADVRPQKDAPSAAVATSAGIPACLF